MIQETTYTVRKDDELELLDETDVYEKLLIVERNGRLKHTILMASSGKREVMVDCDATYELHFIAIGKGEGASHITIRLIGERASAKVFMLTAALDQTNHEGRVHVIHEVPNCTSAVTHRALAGQHSRIDFTGMITIRPQATGSVAGLQSRSLLLSPQASIRSRPEFEILTDDVGCRHGATIGELDEAGLFYLTARGLTETEAKRLLLVAFAEEVTAGIASKHKKNEVNEAFDSFLTRVYAL